MATTTNFGWTTPDDTDLVKDGAAAIRTLGSAIDTSLVDLKGGTTGQVLSKTSNTDMDFTWVAQDDSSAIQNAIVDAKGDLIVATAADTPARLAVGTNGYVLTADSAEATGVKWAAAAAGGMTLLASGSLTSTSVTISSISQAYNNLQIIARDASHYVSCADDTGSTYDILNIESQGNNQTLYSNTNLNTSTFGVGYNDPGTTDLLWFYNIYSYSVSGVKKIYIGHATGGNNIFTNFSSSRGTGAITSITLSNGSGVSWTSGTYELWGIK